MKTYDVYSLSLRLQKTSFDVYENIGMYIVKLNKVTEDSFDVYEKHMMYIVKLKVTEDSFDVYENIGCI